MTDKSTPSIQNRKVFFQFKLNNLPLVYGAIFGALGFILASIFSFMLISLVAGYLGLYVYQGREVPESKMIVLLLLMIVSILFLTNVSVLFGMKYGRALQDKEKDAIKIKTAKLRFIVAILLCSGFFIYIFTTQLFRVKNPTMFRESVSSENLAYNVVTLELNQDGEGVRISGEISGVPAEEYELNVLFVATSFMQEFIFSRQQRIRLDAPTKAYNFYLSFDEIAAAYRWKLSDYVPVFDRLLDLEEIFSVQAVLIPVKALPNVSSNPVATNVDAALLAKKMVLAEFNFHCLHEECVVVQDEVESAPANSQQN